MGRFAWPGTAYMAARSRPEARIRRAAPEDADGLLRCLRLAFEPFRPAYTPGAFADTVLSPASLPGRLRAMTVLLAIAPDGQVVGTLAWALGSRRSGHLRGMAVLPAWQGSGVADRLLAGALSGLGRAGAREVTIGVTAPLQRAVRFYERNGFRPTGRVGEFFGMPLREYRRALP